MALLPQNTHTTCIYYTHKNYKHEPQQRLRGSTLHFGACFFKAFLFLLALKDFCILNPC